MTGPPRRVLLVALLVEACAQRPPVVGTSRPPSAPPPALDPPARPPTSSACDTPSWLLEAEAQEGTDATGAIRLLRACLDQGRGPPSAWRLLATLEEDAGRLERARRTLLRAVATHPADAASWAALARLEAQLGRGAVAIGALERARRLRPDDELLAAEHVRALERHGSQVERRGAELAPLLAEVDGRIELGDLMGAIQVLELARAQAEGADALIARVELRRAVVRIAQGDPVGGLSACDDALARLGVGVDDPLLRAELLITRSEARLAQGEAEAAAADAGAGRALAPAHPFASANLGLALLRLGDASGGVRELDTALGQGLARRIERRAFERLEGVRSVMEMDPAFRDRVEAAWAGEP